MKDDYVMKVKKIEVMELTKSGLRHATEVFTPKKPIPITTTLPIGHALQNWLQWHKKTNLLNLLYKNRGQRVFKLIVSYRGQTLHYYL